ncbi:MAG TPA: DUF5668 domain-containing protein [Candidatus Marinimicrobia bacterium]|nr:DUF5668 domain-containing protein [Candidatus Neomarinimicrobiota bacterium]HRS52216.1 DUF5668 domain-containing protein [Candidatus Neomarinimicrobiota bacterium]HRU92007.1 DUF5668 domain-containing protein [Candidatus Neomarinimicrobiota bacterium]
MSQRKISGAKIAGMVLVVLGVLLLLDNLNLIFFDLGDFLHNWWPLILILIGLNELFKANRSGGWFLIGLGAILILKINDIISGPLLIAMLLILAGIILIIRPRRFYPQEPADNSQAVSIDANTINLLTVFSESTKNIISDNFSGGKIETVFGKMSVDLRLAKMQPSRCCLTVETVFGQTIIILPAEISVEVIATPVFGQIDNQAKAISRDDNPAVLEIRAEVVFGKLEIRQ